MIVGSILGVFCLFILGSGIYFLVEGIKERESFLVFLGLILVLLILTPFTLSIYDTYQKEHSVLTTEEVTLTVSDKKHSSAWTQVISDGKTVNTIYHPESWDITFFDNKDSYKTIDDFSLFEKLKQGDKIEGYRDTYTKKNGEIYKIELRIKGFKD